MLTDKGMRDLRKLAGMQGRLSGCLLFVCGIGFMLMGVYVMHVAYAKMASVGFSFAQFMMLVSPGRSATKPWVVEFLVVGFDFGLMVFCTGILCLVFLSIFRRHRRRQLRMFEAIQKMSDDAIHPAAARAEKSSPTV